MTRQDEIQALALELQQDEGLTPAAALSKARRMVDELYLYSVGWDIEVDREAQALREYAVSWDRTAAMVAA